MKTLGNILWLILTGLWSAIAYFLCGIILCITIIGIPFGKQCFKLAGFVLTPFGKTINTDYNKYPVANILWIIFFGWEMAIGFFVIGALWCITIIGIPFGKQCFKLAQLSFFPFGATYD
ncbi:MAG: YccF domain-containing protein [Clostridia bacterium]|nr:YccF domain-containing protein [Clostridia bacterium]